MAIITPALGAARTSMNKRFPNRDKASDGWIGDAAHQGTRSGHNPDETGNPEYTDSDNVDEVRALDLDADLREAGVSMSDVVAAILRTPTDLNRVSYLIYRRIIWSRSANFIPREYTGSNPHDTHLHISGRPQNDNDDRPWLSIENVGDDMALTKADANTVWNSDGVVANTGDAGRARQPDNTHWMASTYLREIHDAVEVPATDETRAKWGDEYITTGIASRRAMIESRRTRELVEALGEAIGPVSPIPTLSKEEVLTAIRDGAYRAVVEALGSNDA